MLTDMIDNGVVDVLAGPMYLRVWDRYHIVIRILRNTGDVIEHAFSEDTSAF